MKQQQQEQNQQNNKNKTNKTTTMMKPHNYLQKTTRSRIQQQKTTITLYCPGYTTYNEIRK